MIMTQAIDYQSDGTLKVKITLLANISNHLMKKIQNGKGNNPLSKP